MKKILTKRTKNPRVAPTQGQLQRLKGSKYLYKRPVQGILRGCQPEFHPFFQCRKAAIRCLHLLKNKNAPLNAYESVLRWHLIEAKKMRLHESLQDSPYYIGQKMLIKTLIKRYKHENKMSYKKAVRLPVSGTLVRITCHSAQATIQRLLMLVKL